MGGGRQLAASENGTMGGDGLLNRGRLMGYETVHEDALIDGGRLVTSVAGSETLNKDRYGLADGNRQRLGDGNGLAVQNHCPPTHLGGWLGKSGQNEQRGGSAVRRFYF